MRIVIDLQAAQSPGSRQRGIGRYSIALAKGMLRHRGKHEILIALNGMFADTIAPLRETFAGLIEPQDIHVWHASMPPQPVAGAPEGERRAAELVREAFLASLAPDIVHVSSLFESSVYSVTSVHGGNETDKTPVAVTLYDLIPYIYPDIYQPNQQARADYAQKIVHLRRADLFLSISESSRREGVELLGLDASHVVNISSAADPQFTPAVLPAERIAALRARFGLDRPFVMYTGGIDHRKNLEGLIRAWSALPAHLRNAHQLAIVCAVQPEGRALLEELILRCGLAPGDVVLTGFVAEADLVDLYRSCKLFVFPSRHEGFGLPALEAMSCGVPVIGANNSSIPEVIGREDALFDAASDPSITAMLRHYLEDEKSRADLAQHGLERARNFSWDASAQAALAAMERTVDAAHKAPAAAPRKARRPRLAFVTPMPPTRSGIADSSAEVLPHLAAHYDIELILDQSEFDAPPEGTFSATRSAQWFMDHAGDYDRVIYQFGNSSYHEYMFALLERHPGTVILHDFFLSGVVAHGELSNPENTHWTRALYESHGWHAVAQRAHAASPSDIVYRYPANFEVLRNAQGVVVHSEYAMRLARQWYGPTATDDFALVPLPRTPAAAGDRAAARQRLGLTPDDFIVCSFGLLGPIKLNHMLLRAWRSSALASLAGCRLLFVGEPQRSTYGKAFEAELAINPGNVAVTGWTDNSAYEDFLDAADLAVQLRSMSRGETSAAVLDCMNHGLPTIANREGSMADLDPDAVCLLPEKPTETQLAEAIVALWRDPARREAMAQRSRELVHTRHAPAACAAQYAAAIDAFAARAERGAGSLIEQLAGVVPAGNRTLVSALSRAIAQNLPARRPGRQLVVDISQWLRDPAHSFDIPPLLLGLIEEPIPGWRVEAAYLSADGEWRFARQFLLQKLRCPPNLLEDDPLELWEGDLWATIAMEGAAPSGPPQRVVEVGIPALRIPATGDTHLVWSLIAATADEPGLRQWFIDVSELVQRDSLSGIQRVVKNYLLELLTYPPAGARVVPVCATVREPGYFVAERFMLGLAGIETTRESGPRIAPRPGDLFFGLDLQPHVVPAQARYLRQLAAQGVRIGFMVYDLLPVRLPECFGPGATAHHERWLQEVAQADFAVCISQAVADDLARWIRDNTSGGQVPQLHAVHLGSDFSHSLASRGVPMEAAAQLASIRQRPSFLMVGTLEPRKGHAAVLAAFERLWSQGDDIGLVIAGRPGWMVEEIAASLQSHPERDRRLFWMQDSSDEYLEQVYGASVCVIAASLGEGFGLPLVEAAQRGLPVIARDLPVFREVAGDHAFYFSGEGPDALAAALRKWLDLYAQGRHPSSAGMARQSWRESAAQLKQVLVQQAQQRAATAS